MDTLFALFGIACTECQNHNLNNQYDKAIYTTVQEMSLKGIK